MCVFKFEGTTKSLKIRSYDAILIKVLRLRSHEEADIYI